MEVLKVSSKQTHWLQETVNALQSDHCGNLPLVLVRNQAIKAIAIARGYVVLLKDLIAFQPYTLF